MAASIQHNEIPPTSTFPLAAQVANLLTRRHEPQEDNFAAVCAEGPVDQALAIANRGNLDDSAIAILASRPEAAIAHALAVNNRVRINRPILRALIERGRDDPKLAQFLLRRDDLHLCHLRLFLHADAEQRGHLIAITCRSRLGRLCRDDLCHGFDAGKLARFELAALNRDVEAFRKLLAHALSCDPRMAARIAEDKGGEAMALVMVALGLPAENAARILQSGFPDICKSKPSFRALIGIVGRVSRPAAVHILRAIAG
jgi:hypothetical protein